eukprot:TRINITY_DN73859_c0_g1_i1.p1 TRINITY_DN73859_c0_g1~~TRINITY_DN73859_c0_g1_i1.p1  ORF type:complete len:241 (+),score=82.68 TRINITY_DN73859_c0_g1_i1:57-725(+)
MADEAEYNVFDFVGSDEEYDEVEGWREVKVGAFTLELPINRVHVWDSSSMLAEWIVANPESVQGKEVLELGCGLGLPALAAALAGAARVVATDLSEFSVAQLTKAVEHNSKRYPQLACLKASVLDWFKADESTLDTFTCIIAADVNYERCLTEPLTNTVLRHIGHNAPLYLASRSGRVSLNDSLSSLASHLTLLSTKDLFVDEDKHHLLYVFCEGRADHAMA